MFPGCFLNPTRSSILAALLAWPGLAAAGPAPGLDDLVRTALAQNLDLQSASLEAERAQGGLQAASGLFDPQLGSQLEWNQLDQNLVNSAGQPVTGTDGYRKLGLTLSGYTPWSTQYSVAADSIRRNESRDLVLGDPYDYQQFQNFPVEWDNLVKVGITQPLLKGWGSRVASAPVAKARLQVSAAQDRIRQQADRLVADVEQSYAALELAAWQERSGQASLDRAQRLARRDQERQALELATRLDALASEQAVEKRKASLAQAAQAREDAQTRLLRLVYGSGAGTAMGQVHVVLPEAAGAVPGVPDLGDEAACAERAVQQRRNLRAGQEDLEAMRQDLEVARDNLRPTLSFRAGYTLQANRNESSRLTIGNRPFDQAGQGWTVGLVLGVPLFNRAARGAVTQVQVDVRRQELSLQALEQDVRAGVRLALGAIQAARDSLGFALRAQDLARLHYEGEVERMELGLTDSFRVTQVEEELANAELATAQARYDLAKALSVFRFTMGESAQPYL
jgi:outer membrane protein TolC